MALKRARTKSGHYKADDPSTPENEAYEEVTPSRVAKQKKAPVNTEKKKFVYFVSANQEPAAFDVRMGEDTVDGYWDEGREHVHWKVPHDKVDAMMNHHHVFTGRIIPAEDV